MKLDPRDLALFKSIIETGSITAGAERSYMALASASKRVRGMEESLGVPLLLRGQRGVIPTAPGDALYHHARMLLRQYEKMCDELSEYKRGLKGHVRILCNTASFSELMSNKLGTFLAKHPNVNVDLEERRSFEIVMALADETTDVGVVANSVDLGNLQTFPFSHDCMTLICRKDHPLASCSHVNFVDTLDYDFIGMPDGSALQEYLADRANRMGRRIKFRVKLRSFDTICSMVRRGIGICIAPKADADTLLGSRDFHTMGLRDSWASRDLLICVRNLASLPYHAQQLIHSLKS